MRKPGFPPRGRESGLSYGQVLSGETQPGSDPVAQAGLGCGVEGELDDDGGNEFRRGRERAAALWVAVPNGGDELRAWTAVKVLEELPCLAAVAGVLGELLHERILPQLCFHVLVHDSPDSSVATALAGATSGGRVCGWSTSTAGCSHSSV